MSEELSINLDSAPNRSSSSGFHSSALEWRALISSSSTEGFGAAAGCRLSSAVSALGDGNTLSGGARFMYQPNPSPIKPATTNQAPATIIQCGYSISENTSFPLHLQPELDQAADGFGARGLVVLLFSQAGHSERSCASSEEAIGRLDAAFNFKILSFVFWLALHDFHGVV